MHIQRERVRERERERDVYREWAKPEEEDDMCVYRYIHIYIFIQFLSGSWVLGLRG